MTDEIILNFQVKADDFTRAGEASSNVKSMLKRMGVEPTIIRRTAIAMYEGEINMVIHANGGEISVKITSEMITMVLKDKGEGIPNVDKAMQEGFSTASDSARLLGFGAGMGLPNMKKYTDEMKIDTIIGQGTTVTMILHINEEKQNG